MNEKKQMLSIEAIDALDSRDEIMELLKEYFDIDNVPFSKIPKNPKLNDAKKYLRSLVAIVNNDDISTDAKKEDTTGMTAEQKKESERNAKIRKLLAEKDKVVRVIVKDNSYFGGMTDTKGLAEFKPYGNTIIGTETALVLFDKPWVLPLLLVKQLESVMESPYAQDDEAKIPMKLPLSPRYSVQYLPDFTEDELKKIKNRHALRGNQ